MIHKRKPVKQSGIMWCTFAAFISLILFTSTSGDGTYVSVIAAKFGHWVGSWLPPGRAFVYRRIEVQDKMAWASTERYLMPSLGDQSMDNQFVGISYGFPDVVNQEMVTIPVFAMIILVIAAVPMTGIVIYSNNRRRVAGAPFVIADWQIIRVIGNGVMYSAWLSFFALLTMTFAWRFWIGVVGLYMQLNTKLWQRYGLFEVQLVGMAARIFRVEPFVWNETGPAPSLQYVIDFSSYGTGVNLGVDGMVSVMMGGWLLFLTAVLGGVKRAYADAVVDSVARCVGCGYELAPRGEGVGGRCPECGSKERLEAGARPRVWVMPWGPYRRGRLVLGVVAGALLCGPILLAWGRLLWPGPETTMRVPFWSAADIERINEGDDTITVQP